MNVPNQKVKFIAFYILFWVCIVFAFSFLVIKNFSDPLIGLFGYGSDTFINHDYADANGEYMGFYLSQNISFTPFAKLNILNNQVFYPYGTNSIFQTWVLERDIYYAIFYSFFGAGHWLQIYYLFTVLVTAIGTLGLLVRDYGFARASGAGLLVSFFNFYAIHKYPHHFNVAVHHWTTVSFVADFLIVKRVALRQHVSLNLILIRACLLILSMGQDLGYIAGFALMSFTVSTLFIAVLIAYRHLKGELRINELFTTAIQTYKSEFLANPITALCLLCLSLIVGFIYLPLLLQISREAKSLETNFGSSGFLVNPLRLLIPYFPGFNPGLPWEKVFRDSPEGLGAGSPGWFLLILGTLGLWQARKQILYYIPLSIIFLLCIFNHPGSIPTINKWVFFLFMTVVLWVFRKRTPIFLIILFIGVCLILYKQMYFPTLKIFPWFSFNRVAGRSTVIYPVILCIFAMEFNLYNWHFTKKKLLSALLIFLACTEIFTAYSFNLEYQPYSLKKDFFTYMNYVRQQPGEAVVDWPFCIASGNGVGAREGLCPYFLRNAGVFALRRFHQKKVMGQYFGRLHPDQIGPYLEAGWNKLFFPDSSIKNPANRQERCFRPAEWSFFTDFYKFNDFAGINLYVDLLPKDCISEFYARFGNPAVETWVPGPGKVQFIAKPSELRSQVNPALGRSLKLETYLSGK